MKASPCSTKFAIAKCLFSLIAVVLASSNLAHAQSQAIPQEAIDEAKRLGLTKDSPIPPNFYQMAPNTHYSATPPANFPVAVYKSNVTRTAFVNSTKGAPAANLTIVTKDPATNVNQFYLSALRGGSWTVQAPTPEALAKMGAPGSIYMLQGTRNKERVVVNIFAVPGSPPSTNISVNWSVGY